jgi:hypothetical protein
LVKALIAFGIVTGYKILKWVIREISSRRREKIWWEKKHNVQDML